MNCGPIPAMVGVVARAAANLLRQQGWCQHLIRKSTGERCLLGALQDASWQVTNVQHERDVLLAGAVNAAHERISLPCAWWNDMPGRTADEVIGMLEGLGAA